MGYRSDLMVLIYPDTDKKADDTGPYETLKTLMNTTFKEVTDEFSSFIEWLPDMHCLKFKIDDVKWYESDPDVARFNEMLEFFRDESHGYCTEVVRIGEDYDDVESNSSGHNMRFLLGVRREIECAI
jgi:hypothetical protein